MPFTPANTSLTRNLQRFADLPNKYAILCSPTAPFTSAVTMAEVVAAESTGTGYLRQAYTPGAAVYDAGQSRSELASVSCSFAAGATGYSFTSAVLLSGASAVASKAITAVDTGANTITVAGHGLTIGDRVLVSADPNGVLPSPLTSVIYYVQSVPSSDTFTLSASLNGTQTDIASSGTLPLRLRYANGEVELYETFGSITTIPASGSHAISISINTAGGDTTSVNAA